jgi:2-polyprenyl-6-methoxyphenol hydroxylase-like FAD-dependent oxidoreductase
MKTVGDHAVVLGGSIAGLLAARVLVDAYERVTIVERDDLVGAGHGHKGVPQGRHAHALLARGQAALEELFPGLFDELVERGAVTARPGLDHRFVLGGHLLLQVPAGDRALQASRPFLEEHLRRHVVGTPGVELLAGCDIVGLTAGDDGALITGARLVRRAAGSSAEALRADLVVDAMGRGSRVTRWLEDIGHEQPPTDELRIDVGYASRFVRLPENADDIDKAVIVGPQPGNPRGMALLAVEGGRHLLTLAGIAGHHPPVDEDGLRGFVNTIAPRDVAEVIRSSEPLGNPVSYRYPTVLRRHFEQVRRPPAGLIVTGDALCSFNPVYAQGITVAALEALALRRSLAGGADGLAPRFFRAAATTLNDPWRLAIGADLAMPEVAGRRTLATRLLNAYVGRVQAAAEHDATVAERFLRVIGLLDPPSSLLSPAVATRVFLRSRPDQTGHGPASATTTANRHAGAQRTQVDAASMPTVG